MSAWIVFLIVALVFFIAEIYTPTMFFLNFSAAAVLCAGFSFMTDRYDILIPIFAVLSILFIIFLRPFLNINPKKSKEHDFEAQYLGKQATVLSEVSAFSGRINIYDENWEARLANPELPNIATGQQVTITRHDNLTMYVEPISTKGKKK
jgi:membrane protein implicated in regulation of membrane protease activity